jgi:hypothetical protein
MSQPVVRYWASANDNIATISPIRDYTGAGNVEINSNLPNSPISTYGPYVFDANTARSLSFSSVNNLSARNLTITGLGSALDASSNPTQPLYTAITDVVAGPNANTIYTTKIWTQIDSITIDGAANGLLVGFGDKGITRFIFPDFDVITWDATVQAAVYNRTTLTYTIYQTLTKPEVPTLAGNLQPYPLTIPAFPIGAVDGFTNQLITYPSPVVMTWATIENAADEEMYFTFLQQGLRS